MSFLCRELRWLIITVAPQYDIYPNDGIYPRDVVAMEMIKMITPHSLYSII